MGKRGSAIYFMLIGVAIYLLSILMPWVTVGFGVVAGYSFRSYLLLILFIYPVYTVIRNIPLNAKYGIFCGVIPIGVLVVMYFNITREVEELDIPIAKASFGYYTALAGCFLVLIGIFMKLRRQNRATERVKSSENE